jgi:hypothetical protein
MRGGTPAAPVGATVAVLVFAVVGCYEESMGPICTEIGCESGVEIRVVPQPVGPFRVEVSPPGSLASYVRDCENGATCTRVFFADFTPDYVNVRVIVTSDTVYLEAIRLEYDEFRPNGPDCPPLCRIARVDVKLPG